MPEPKTAPYGTWKSPITSDLIVKGSIGLTQLQTDGENIYWIEARPSEAGRQVIVRLAPDGSRTDINPAPLNARTRVHEYGGGEYLAHNGAVYFSNYADQQLYQQTGGAAPKRLTADDAGDKLRYADSVADARRNRLICVCEDHLEAGREAKNYLAAVSVSDGSISVLV